MSVQKAVCHCGLLVIKDDEELMVAHEVPECDWFKGLLRKAHERFPNSKPPREGIAFFDKRTGHLTRAGQS